MGDEGRDDGTSVFAWYDRDVRNTYDRDMLYLYIGVSDRDSSRHRLLYLVDGKTNHTYYALDALTRDSVNS